MKTTRSLSLRVALAATCIFFSAQAGAQAPPAPPPIAVAGPTVSLATSTTSARVTLGSAAPSFNTVQVYNAGSALAFFTYGNSSVTAATTSIPVSPGNCAAVWSGAAGYVAGLASSGTGILYITQYNGAPTGNCTAGTTGTVVSSNSTIVSPLDGSGNVKTAPQTLPPGASTDASLTNGNLKSTAGVELLDSGGTNKASISAAGAVKTDSSATTQPVSVAALPLPAGAATDASLTNGNLKSTAGVELLDSAGTNKAAISAAGAVKVDNSAVTQPVSAASLPLPSGASTDASLTNGNLKSTAGMELLDSGGTNKASISAAGAVKTDSSATTQPVSAASLPLPSGAATDASLTNGNLKSTAGVELLDSGGTNKASISAAGAVKTDSSASTQPVSLPSVDPCQTPGVAKLSAAVSVAAAGTNQIVGLSAGKVIYVCNFAVTVTGTGPSFKWQYGTGTNCATGPVDLTGTFSPLANGFVQDAGPGTIFSTAASNELCTVLTGTAPGLQGFVTYVQL